MTTRDILVTLLFLVSMYGHLVGLVSLALCRVDAQARFTNLEQAQRNSVNRVDFDFVSDLARQATDKAKELDARLLVLEGRPPRPDARIDPEDG